MINKIIEYFIDKLFEYLMPTILSLGVFGLIILIIIIIFKSPEKVEKWLSMIWQTIYFIFKRGQRKIISYDIQGRINEFANLLKKEFPSFNPIGINVQWINENEKASDFFKDDKLVIRLKHHHDQDKNFVKVSMIFISRVLLSKTKKYISPSQKKSIDLYVAKRLFEEEKPRVVDHFFEKYYSESSFNSEKIADLLDKYHLIDKVGLFFPVLLQELTFLGEKVFYKPKNEDIIVEVAEFIDFLAKYASRNIGDQTIKTDFEGSYCRCGIMIIAKVIKRNIGDIAPYVNYSKKLLENKMENIYLIGSSSEDNKSFMESIGAQIISQFGLEKYSNKSFKAKIKIKGERFEVDSYFIHLRSRKAIRTYDSEYQSKYIKKDNENA